MGWGVRRPAGGAHAAPLAKARQRRAALDGEFGAYPPRTGYQEPVAIEEAIRRTIRWERENPPAAALLAQFDYAAEDAAVAGHNS